MALSYKNVYQVVTKSKKLQNYDISGIENAVVVWLWLPLADCGIIMPTLLCSSSRLKEEQMSKLSCKIPAQLITLTIIGVVLMLSILVSGIDATSKGGEQKSEGEDEGFAIYLTKQDIPPAQMEDSSHVDIAEEPIITISDVITYDAQEHELRLAASAFERISQLDVPTSGRSFIVCVDKQPIYWGAFWVLWSSQSFDGVTIWKPLILEETHAIRLELGYASSELYTGEDPRSNPTVMESLEQAGKLISGLCQRQWTSFHIL